MTGRSAGGMGTRTVDQPLIERWDGRAWKQVASYSSGDPHGKILIERRTGGTWSQMPAGR